MHTIIIVFLHKVLLENKVTIILVPENFGPAKAQRSVLNPKASEAIYFQARTVGEEWNRAGKRSLLGHTFRNNTG